VFPSAAGIMASRRSCDAGSHGSVSKLLLLVIAIAVVYFVFRGVARKRGAPPSPFRSETMIPCAHCGVNIPRSEAVEGAGRFFCSEEHRRVGTR